MVEHQPRGHRPKGSQHVGVALGATELVATPLGARTDADVVRIALEQASTELATWPALERAFTDLRANLGAMRLSVSLLPPLAEVRAVDLPPLRNDDAERVLARGASRYFVGARQSQVVGVVRGGRGRRPVARGGPLVAAAAPARLLAAIRTAAQGAGLSIDAIGPAESAWAAAAMAFAPRKNSGAAFVLVCHADRTDLLRLEAGQLAGVRRFRAATADADAMSAAVRGESSAVPWVVVLGSPDDRGVLQRDLLARGIGTRTLSEDSDEEDPTLLAAQHAAPAAGPLFRTEDLRAESRARVWRATAITIGAAAVLLIAGAELRLWGLHRQLRLLQQQRAQLAPRLQATLVGRTSVETIYRSAAALNAVERSSPAWGSTIGVLTAAVPDSAYLTAFRTRGDSLIVEGLADQASDVFNAMEQIPTLANVRAGAPVRREVQSDTTPMERFTIVALRVSERDR